MLYARSSLNMNIARVQIAAMCRSANAAHMATDELGAGRAGDDGGVLAGPVGDVVGRLVDPSVGGDLAIAPDSDALSRGETRDTATAPVVDLALRHSNAERTQGEYGVLLREATSSEIRGEPVGPTHRHQYADSDSDVKRFVSQESESLSPRSGTVRAMGGKDAEPLAEFVRHLIRQWEARGRTLRQLKLDAGWPKSNSQVDQIKKGSSVTEYTGTKLAVPLGYQDFPDLVSAAYRWWRSQDRALIPDSEAETPLAEAIRLAQQYGVMHAQIERAIARVPPDAQPALDALSWLSLFHDEKSLDARIDAELRAAAHTASAQRARVESAQAEMRQVVEVKQEAKRASKRKRKAG